MRVSFVAFLAGVLALVVSSVSGCAAPQEQDEDDADVVADDEAALTSPPLSKSDLKPIPRPAGMPAAWAQPDSTGLFDERGKCGPTAVANALRLYSIEVSPQQADADGVHSIIGTRGTAIRNYLDREHPQLGCDVEHPTNGGRFLRDSLAAGRPVMIWFMSGDSFQSHWVTAVGRRGTGADEKVIVMTWGRYYTIPMNKLLASWRSVYGLRNPSVVCDRTTTKIAR